MADYSGAYEGTGFEKGVHSTNPPSIRDLQRQVTRLEKVVAKMEAQLDSAGINPLPKKYRVIANRDVTYYTTANSPEDALKWYYETGCNTVPSLLPPPSIRVEVVTDEDLL